MGNLEDAIFKSSNAWALPREGGGGRRVMLKFHVDRRITDLGEKSRVPQIGKISAQLAGIPATRVLIK